MPCHDIIKNSSNVNGHNKDQAQGKKEVDNLRFI